VLIIIIIIIIIIEFVERRDAEDTDALVLLRYAYAAVK